MNLYIIKIQFFGKNISQGMLNYEVHNLPGCKIVSRQKYEDSKKISGSQALGEKCEMTEHRIFISGTILHETIMVNTFHRTFVKIYRMYATKSEP